MVVTYDKASPKDSSLYTRIQKARSKLEKDIEEWSTRQSAVMGQLIAIAKMECPDASWSSASEELPEDVSLPIPSNLPAPLRSHNLLSAFTHTELRLRQGIANDLLAELREKLGLSGFLWGKKRGAFGQSDIKTRTSKSVEGLQDRIREIRTEYNHIRERMVTLGEPSNSHNYQVLTPNDCQAPQIFHSQREDMRRTEKEVRWIWREGSYTTEEGMKKWELEGSILSSI